MNYLLAFTIPRTKTILLLLFFFIFSGSISYIEMPKEAQPDIAIPFINVVVTQRGISPEDSERLLARPLERELRNVEGMKEMTTYTSEGRCTVTLEFEAGFDVDIALADVRELVDRVKPDLPDDADEPEVNEVNFSLFPVLIVGLAGDIDERALQTIARNLKDTLEGLSPVLEAKIDGRLTEVVEVLLDKDKFNTYQIDLQQAVNAVNLNNRIVPAGIFDEGRGRIPFKVPGIYKESTDLFQVPILARGDKLVTFKDVADIQMTYFSPTSFARIGGQSALAIQVIKRTGENIIDTVELVKATVERESQFWPEGIQVSFFQDKSGDIRNMLLDLRNNLISAILLVMIVVLATLGPRTAILVGISIPGSFLSGLFILHAFGISINIVVLFSLILVVGMLVDGAIVVTEMADRKMAEGIPPKQAYILASQRMALPIISSTATTLAAFMPLLFWPGVVGEFMKFLPITLICTLSASLVMALIFVPSVGTMIGRASVQGTDALRKLTAAEDGDFSQIGGVLGRYIRVLDKLLHYPGRIFLAACVLLIVTYGAYIKLGKGVEFFPDVDPENAQVIVKMRGNLSIYEMDDAVREVESRILGMEELASVYTKVGTDLVDRDVTEDTRGIIYLELIDWQKRRRAKEILAEIRDRTADIPGVIVETTFERAGPPVGKPVRVQLSSRFPDALDEAVETVLQKFKSMPDLVDIDDSRSLPEYELQFNVNRNNALRFGTYIESAGNVIQFLTSGYKADTYRPDEIDDEVDIRLRFAREDRNMLDASDLLVPTPRGMIPLANFTDIKPAARTTLIQRLDGKRTYSVRADLRNGALADDQVRELTQWFLKERPIDPRVKAEFKGEDEEQRKSQAFLTKAFLYALAVMAIILVTQFNSFYDAFLILTAVVFSTVGVLIGLLITHQPFGIVMNGIGVISLAGIVVNNNIVLIDTYQLNRKRGVEAREAILRTCAQRMRPVLLTTVTTILGLIPMVFSLNLDFFDRSIEYGAPSTQWWRQLATSVAFGLAFATVLTLILTPSLIMLGHKMEQTFLSFFKPKK